VVIGNRILRATLIAVGTRVVGVVLVIFDVVVGTVAGVVAGVVALVVIVGLWGLTPLLVRRIRAR
jgi:hypothetical protein